MAFGDNVNDMSKLMSNCRKLKLKSNHIIHSPIPPTVVYAMAFRDNVNDMRKLMSNCRKVKLKSNHIIHSPIPHQVV